jgi:hypothetical protein
LEIAKCSEKEIERLRFCLLDSKKIPEQFMQLQESAKALERLKQKPELQANIEYMNKVLSLENEIEALVNEWRLKLPLIDSSNPEEWQDLLRKAKEIRAREEALQKGNTIMEMKSFWKKKEK